MKKILFSAIAAIGLLLSPGCSDDNEVVSGGNDSLVSFSVGLENGIQTKAISDGKTAKNLVVGVYEKIGDSYEEIPALRHKEADAFNATTSEDKPKAEVTFNLVKGKTYGFVFWAQKQAVDGSVTTPFKIDDLQNIEVDYSAANCNDEARDAFVGVVKDFKVSGTYEQEVTLKRPFAQLNFLVTKDELEAAEASTNFKLKQSQITLSQAATMLQPFTNTVSTPVDATVTFKPAAIPMLSDEYNNTNSQTHPKVGYPNANDTYYYLATTYFLVPAAGTDDNAGKARTTLSSVNLKLANDEGTLADGPGFTAHTVPVQWNYRTNIYGNLLTADGQFNVEIVPDFDTSENPDNNVEQPQTVMVASVDEVPKAIADGATKVSIQEAPTAAPAQADQMIPKVFAQDNDKKIEIEFQQPLPTGYAITYSNVQPSVGTAEGTSAPAEVHFTAPSNSSSDLTVNLDESTVTVNGVYRNVEATTKDNTLIVSSGTIIDYLKVNKGNVEIYGTGIVKEIEKVNGYQGTITYNISTAEQLSGLATAINAGNSDLYTMLGKVDAIHLENDIDLNNEEWEPIGTKDNPFKFTFDGQNHTISNLSINKPTDAYVGLFGDLNTPGKIQNVKIENASVKGQSRVGALVGASYTGTISNCTVSGKIRIEGNYQVGGLAGQGYAHISDCSVIGNSGSYVKGVYKQDNLEGDAVGGIIGYYAEGEKTLANCTASINVEGTRKVGGLAGQIGANVTVDGCKFTGTVSTNASEDYIAANKGKIMIGGIVGEATGTPVTIVNSTITSGSVVIGLDPATTGLIIGGSRVTNPSITQTGNTFTGAILQVAIASGVTLVNGVYEIYNAQGLKWLASTVNAGTNLKGKTVKLANDIDLNNEEWTPIGKSGATFQGIFDGDNHTISNLKITDSDQSDVGLFGITRDGEVKNFTLHNASVKGYLDVGAVAGTPYTSKYTNIKLTGVVKIDGYAYVGGMFGKNAYANLTDLTIAVSADSYVKADSENYRTYVGGLVGFMGEGGHKVSNVTSNINVTGSTCDVGGITGIAHYNNTFENCTCTGNVTLTGASDAGDQLEIGGIAGVWHNQNGTKVTFRNCSFTGVLKTFLNGVDCSADVAESNKITGRKYSTSGTGELVIEK